MKRILIFLLDVFYCSLSSFGGPEAHYGVFSQILVDKKKYIDEKTLSELIGVFALVPGPSSTQTITAIGYLVGGPWIACLTFVIWALPALLTMTLVGLFFSFFDQSPFLTSLLGVLPAIAVGFIFYAGWSLSKRILSKKLDWLLYGFSFLAGFLFIPITYLAVPFILLASGFVLLLIVKSPRETEVITAKPRWFILLAVVVMAILLEFLSNQIPLPVLGLINSFFRYGYSVIGGGQIVMPLMIQDLVTQQSLLSLETFLSGYAIDQAIPGPLFSFAAFVGTQSLQGLPFPWLGGFFAGLSIFVPGVMLVYFVVPIWQTLREILWLKTVLKGITIAAASLIVLTGFNQILALSTEWLTYVMVALTYFTLQWKKIPTPILVGLLITIGLLLQSIN